jgi:hypothetical protein
VNYMESEDTKIKSLSERRFGSIILLLRLAGLPFQMKKISTIYAIYMTTAIICTCSTYVGTFADAYVHRDDLGQAMTTIRVFIPMSNVVWAYFCCRYVITLVGTVTASRCLFQKPSTTF